MPEVQYTRLNIPRHSGERLPGGKQLPGDEQLPNRFLRLPQASNLAILFPGLYYSNDMPLLYYASQVLLGYETDVLQLWADYASPQFTRLPDDQRAHLVSADADSILRAGMSQKKYQHLILVGKSIGTLGVAHLVEARSSEDSPLVIWLTPLFHQKGVVEAGMKSGSRSLFVVGAGDGTYDATALKRIQDATGAQSLIVENANHSLEIPGDPTRSIQALGEVAGKITAFLDQQAIKPK